jgi:hypothetical protein
MYRLTGLLVALMIAIFPGNLAAQRGGGARMGGGGGVHVGGFAGRGGTPVTSFRGSPVTAFRGSSTFNHPAPLRSFARPVVVSPFGFYGGFSPFYSPFSSPFYSSPFDWGSSYAPPYGYSTPSPAYSAPSYSVPAPAPDSSMDLAYQVGQLNQQIAELRAEQAARSSQTAPAGLGSRSAQTLLIYRDGRRQEIQNYAIVGQTLWVFDEHTSTRIALSDLDLTATQNENRQRGTRFTVPEK